MDQRPLAPVAVDRGYGRVTGDFRAFLREMQQVGPGKRGEPTYAYRLAVLIDSDFLDAVDRDDRTGAANALSAVIARIYGKDVPTSVRISANAMGVKVPAL